MFISIADLPVFVAFWRVTYCENIGILLKNIAVFSEKTDDPHLPNQFSFSHEAVTLKIRSRSPKSNKLMILSNLYRLANVVTFHPMVHEIISRQTFFGLLFVD